MDTVNEGEETNSNSTPIKDEGSLLSIAIDQALGAMLGYSVGRKDERVEKVLCEYVNFHGVPIRVF